jgi:hypothetical protein
VVEPTHPGSNPRFDVSVVYLRLIILSVVGDVPIDSETLFDRLREKIKLVQYFRCAHMGKMCVRVFIMVSVYSCMSIGVCTVWHPTKK